MVGLKKKKKKVFDIKTLLSSNVFGFRHLVYDLQLKSCSNRRTNWQPVP